MVRHSGALGGRGLCRADVHPAVDLHGIGGDNFTAEGKGKGDAEGRLSTRRGACDNQNFFGFVHTMRLKSLSRSLRVRTEETGLPWGQ